jgi:ferric-chelate reductase
MEQGRIAVENDEKVDTVRVPVHVTVDGPYGGCCLDLGEYENVLFVAGGAGVTFIIGLLDDIVGRIVRHKRGRGERTRRVEFAWAIRSYGE